MNHSLHKCLAMIAIAMVCGCDRTVASGPPVVRLGDSVCAECNMIISDERWATATMVEGSRGLEPRLFDDFNCQVNFEVGNKGLQIHARWSHDYATREWIPTEDAHFLIAADLRSPMGSNLAAFATIADADEIKAQSAGELMTFGEAWQHLGETGSEHADLQPADRGSEPGPISDP